MPTFSSETMKARREWGRIFKASKGNPYQSRTVYPHDTIDYKQEKERNCLRPKQNGRNLLPVQMPGNFSFSGKRKIT